jgi:DNA-binding transcriptional MocR family regulator
VRAGARHSVRFSPGPLSHGRAHDARLCFAFYSEPELRVAVARLGAALAEHLAAA